MREILFSSVSQGFEMTLVIPKRRIFVFASVYDLLESPTDAIIRM